MHMLKLLFQKLQIRPILAPGRNSQPPGALLKMYHLGTSGGIQAFVFQCSRERQTTTHAWEQLTAQGENPVVSFT